MALYPDILFHFTTEENLYKILASSFQPSYARERVIGGEVVKEFGVPMVSFSDLRLSELHTNIESYGNFGIGMKKDWAIRKGLNPVMYVSDQSFFTKNFLTGLETYFDMVNNDLDTSGRNEQGYNQVLNTLRYMKNYRGVLIRRNKLNQEDYVFANEREWRFVPPFSEDYYPIIPIEKLQSSQLKEEMNRKIDHITLEFNPDEIMYLIVENDRNINPLIKHLRDVKGRFDAFMIDRLTSRILTYEQIKNDI